MEKKILNSLKNCSLTLDLISKLINVDEDKLKPVLDSMLEKGLIKYSSNTELYKLAKVKNKRTNVTNEMVYECIKNYEMISINDLAIKLKTSKKELDTILKGLCSELKIYYERHSELYCVIKEASLIVKDKVTFASVEGEENDYYICDYNGLIPYNGDKAYICPIHKVSYGKTEAILIKIIERAHKIIIGKLRIKENKKRNKLICNIISSSNSFDVIARVDEADLAGAKNGQIVEGEIIEYKNSEIIARVSRIIGNPNDIGIDITQIAIEYGFKLEFSDETIKELDNIPDYVSSKELKGRRDFRDLNVITIDGDDSKDFDDAVYLEFDNDGNYLLYVFIADVAEYVTEGSSLNNDALERGTSLYLADRVVPMLPKKLSNGICSLNEGVDRLTLACIMTIDSKGRLINYDICESVINSHHRMTYNKVNLILNGDEELCKEYSDIKDMLINMSKLSHIIREVRYKKGGLDFESDEYKFILDEKGKPIDIVKRIRDDAEMLIEDFMLSANETVAYHMNIMNLPCMYRIHEKPDQEKLHNTFITLKAMNLPINDKKSDIKPHDIQIFLNNVKDNPNFSIINNLLLRSMMKAKYSEKCLGHYGLAMNYYCHFTSPIRRYPDLITHRLIKKLLLHPSDNFEFDLEHYISILPEIAIKNSLSEKKAIDCERSVDDMMFSWYMSDKISKQYIGTITSITAFGMFVTLSFGVEGLVMYKNLNSYFEYDEKTMTASDGKKTYHLGDKVSVIVLDSNKKTRKIDFVIEGHERRFFYEDYMY